MTARLKKISVDNLKKVKELFAKGKSVKEVCEELKLESYPYLYTLRANIMAAKAETAKKAQASKKARQEQGDYKAIRLEEPSYPAIKGLVLTASEAQLMRAGLKLLNEALGGLINA